MDDVENVTYAGLENLFKRHEFVVSLQDDKKNASDYRILNAIRNQLNQCIKTAVKNYNHDTTYRSIVTLGRLTLDSGKLTERLKEVETLIQGKPKNLQNMILVGVEEAYSLLMKETGADFNQEIDRSLERLSF